MTAEFAAYITKENLCSPEDRILVSVSGGPDSVLLAHLFHQAGYRIGLAHCNFGLRGEHSDADELFVREMASSWKVPFFQISFPTREKAAEWGKSIQETARDLRYEWLESLLLKEGYDLIATGHHLGDSVETLLFHLAKGCGIRGLHGILPKRGRLIRPLLFTGKESILAYLGENAIPFREDLSNRERHYDRNKIRHGVIPVLESINPRFEESAKNTLQLIREAESLYDFAVKHWLERAVEPMNNGFRISWEVLMESPSPATLLHEFLSPYGFQPAQYRDLFEKDKPAPGKRWFSNTHCLLSDRLDLLLAPLARTQPGRFPIPAEAREIAVPGGILYIEQQEASPAHWPETQFEACLNGAMVEFPLLLRRWEAGDHFQPLGMKGQSKKLQDLFTDLKLSRFEKENVWVLEISGQIAWVVGHRIDERFKLWEDSASCWHFRFERMQEP